MSVMAETASLKSLHLEYRIWIAELNLDINLIRIFNDRVIEMTGENHPGDSKSIIEVFKSKFNVCRETIDELRHRMHIEKMNLAATAREQSDPYNLTDFLKNYGIIREDFFAFRVTFNELKNEFLKFENRKPI